jgi:menaquinone reductase, iron-sulfur cluster-binding subunit
MSGDRELQAAKDSEISRRRFASLLAGAVGAAALTAVPRALRAQEAPAPEEPAEPEPPPEPYPEEPPRKWGMSIDLDLCTACGACVVACRTENNVPCTGPAEERQGTGIYWMNLLPAAEETQFGEQADETLPLPCQHCEDAPCVKVCPTNATYISDEGLVAQIYDRCIGCRYCMIACPYSVRHFNWGEPEWPDSFRSFLNPDVSTRPRGVVEKCSFCHHRIQSAQETFRLEREIVPDGELQKLTACAEACPAEAIVFGDLNDAESRVSRMHRSPRAFRLLESLGTKPKVVYLARDRREGES